MKIPALTIIEQYSPHIDSPNQVVRQTITAWLTKELHK